MTKEDSIKKADEIIDKLRKSISDIEEVKNEFIDFDLNENKSKWIDTAIVTDSDLIGAFLSPKNESEERINLVYYHDDYFFIKNIMK